MVDAGVEEHAIETVGQSRHWRLRLCDGAECEVVRIYARYGEGSTLLLGLVIEMFGGKGLYFLSPGIFTLFSRLGSLRCLADSVWDPNGCQRCLAGSVWYSYGSQ